jgi:phosphatidylethanolamine/phosphatidyl-N-methylethanolamine N-methyltransferase
MQPDVHTALDATAVRAAYRRWAAVYDTVFGGISAPARRRAAAAVNALPGERVLEVGVGTGLALPLYDPRWRITGIDLSAEMLLRARKRVVADGLRNVEALLEADAEATGLPGCSFDVAVAMFVASVVPKPRRLVTEMRRLVRPGGWLLFANHFAAERGPRWWAERALGPASHALGWHPDFPITALLSPEERAMARSRDLPPFGLFTLVQIPR